MSALPDPDFCYEAARSRDPRFDGQFVLAVTSTGIYCRPSCPAMTPKRANVRFYQTPATAQSAGFRACLRCLPDAAPGSPDWNLRADLVGRAMRLVGDGVVERAGVAGLADRLGYSARHLNRQLIAELGVGPLALARARRAQIARTLIETTTLPFAEVAFAAGFSSVRQFNDTVREVFATTPSRLRAHRRPGANGGPGTISLRLAYREPFDAASLWAFLGARAVTGVEDFTDGTYRRTLRLPHGVGTVALTPAERHVRAELDLADLRDLGTAVQRCRRLLDLDADPVAIDAALGADPALAPMVAARPGLRVPGAVDGPEIAVRAVLGQQVSVAAARTVAGRLAAAHGEPTECIEHSDHPTLNRLFPRPEALARLDPATLPMPASRARTLVTLCAALAAGDVILDAGTDPTEAMVALEALPGIGPWTAGYIALRATGAPDIFLPGDLGVRRSAARLGLTEPLDERAARWRPWRSYAVLHLWNSEPKD